MNGKSELHILLPSKKLSPMSYGGSIRNTAPRSQAFQNKKGAVIATWGRRIARLFAFGYLSILPTPACSTKTSPPTTTELQTKAAAEKPTPKSQSEDWGGQEVTAAQDFHWAFTKRESWVCLARLEDHRCPGPRYRMQSGKALEKLDPIRIVGNAPIDGQWRAIWEQEVVDQEGLKQKGLKQKGLKAGWVLASDVDFEPLIDNSEKLARDPNYSDSKATDSSHPDRKALAKPLSDRWELRSIRVVKTTKLRLASWEQPHRERPVLFLDWGDSSIALELPSFLPYSNGVISSMTSTYLDNHQCVKNGTCHILNYICDHGYCDKVSFVAWFLGKSIRIPASVRTAWKDAPIDPLPLYRVSELVDRFGTHTDGGPRDGHYMEPLSERLAAGGTSLRNFISKEHGLGVSYRYNDGAEEDTLLSAHVCGAKLEEVLKDYEAAFREGAHIDRHHCWGIAKDTVACRSYGGHDAPDLTLIFEEGVKQQVVLRTIAMTDSEVSDVYATKQEATMLREHRRYAKKRCSSKGD